MPLCVGLCALPVETNKGWLCEKRMKKSRSNETLLKENIVCDGCVLFVNRVG